MNRDKFTLEYVDALPVDDGMYGSMWDAPLDEFVASGRSVAKQRGEIYLERRREEWA